MAPFYMDTQAHILQFFSVLTQSALLFSLPKVVHQWQALLSVLLECKHITLTSLSADFTAFSLNQPRANIVTPRKVSYFVYEQNADQWHFLYFKLWPSSQGQSV